MRCRHSLLKKTSVTLLFFAASCAQAQDAEDLCRDVLVYAAHNQYQSLSTSDMQHDMHDALCSGSETGSGGGSSHGNNLQVFGYGSDNYNDAQNQYNSTKANSCGSHSDQLSNADYNFLLKNTIDKDSVQAWKDCMARDGKGARGLIQRTGKDIELTVWWAADLGQDSATVTDDGVITGVTGRCATQHWPRTGLVLNSAKQSTICTWDGRSDVAIVVQTDHGSWTQRVPAPVAQAPVVPPSPRSNADRCLGGETSYCQAAFADLGTCGPTDGHCIHRAQCFQNLTTADLMTHMCGGDPFACANAKRGLEMTKQACRDPDHMPAFNGGPPAGFVPQTPGNQ